MRYCRVCGKVQEFKPVPISITLNWNRALQYCLACKAVVFVEAVEAVEVEKRESRRELVGAVA